MNIDLIPIFSLLEETAIHGPGRHELVRIFFAYQRRVPVSERFWTFTDNYGKVYVRAKDVEAVKLTVLPPPEKCQQKSTIPADS